MRTSRRCANSLERFVRWGYACVVFELLPSGKPVHAVSDCYAKQHTFLFAEPVVLFDRLLPPFAASSWPGAATTNTVFLTGPPQNVVSHDTIVRVALGEEG
jgi:hypothetical protein